MYENIDFETVQSIKNSTRIEDYIGRYIDLTKEQNSLVGLCPFHKEKTPSFKINTEEQYYHCFGCHATGDVIDFAQKYHNLNYVNAVKNVANFSGVTVSARNISDTIKIFRKYKPREKKIQPIHPIIDKSEWLKYDKCNIGLWEQEGILPETIDEYDIRFDKKCGRIIYPVYDIDGNLINIKGRTINEYWKELKIPKYMNYYKVGSLDYLQELNKAKDYIEQKHEIIIFEGIKSCMKAHQFGIRNQVSAETSILKYEQVRLILSLGCDVVIAFDKDKTLRDFANNDLKLLARFTNVFYINDRDNLLGLPEDKNSPVDKGVEVWNELYKNKERVIF